MHTEVGSGKKQRGLGEEARLGSGERKAGLGATMRSPDKPTHRWPPDGQAAHAGLCRFRGRTPGPPGTNDAIRPAPPPSQNAGADPLEHRSFMESA